MPVSGMSQSARQPLCRKFIVKRWSPGSFLPLLLGSPALATLFTPHIKRSHNVVKPFLLVNDSLGRMLISYPVMMPSPVECSRQVPLSQLLNVSGIRFTVIHTNMKGQRGEKCKYCLSKRACLKKLVTLHSHLCSCPLFWNWQIWRIHIPASIRGFTQARRL